MSGRRRPSRARRWDVDTALGARQQAASIAALMASAVTSLPIAAAGKEDAVDVAGGAIDAAATPVAALERDAHKAFREKRRLFDLPSGDGGQIAVVGGDGTDVDAVHQAAADDRPFVRPEDDRVVAEGERQQRRRLSTAASPGGCAVDPTPAADPESTSQRAPKGGSGREANVSSLRWRVRWGSDERLRHLPDNLVWIAEPGASSVTANRNTIAAIEAARRKLAPEQESTIRALARTKSLRSLAADFGVSHETVRSICRRAERSA
jgi:hypothetical protein